MPTNDSADTLPDYDPLVFSRNMAEAMFRTQHIASHFAGEQNNKNIDAPFDPFHVAGAFAEFYKTLLDDPKKLTDASANWWQNSMDLWEYAAKKMLGDEEAKPLIAPNADKRFEGDAWQDRPLFDVLRQAYLLTSKSMVDLVGDAKDLDPKTKQKVEFYTRQWIDALSPSNYLMTNPKVLEATLGSNGENLLKGLDNLEHDLKSGKISMTDGAAFEVGKNLATTDGYVVHQNELMELIQYSPTTEQVHEVPLLLIPAWINKYYILDLQQKNSFIKWLIDQGYTVFVISWANPSEALADKNFDDYMKLGPIAAMEVIQKRCKCDNINMTGYCLGGTLLSMTLAYLHEQKKADSILSATYLTTMIDFSDAGELSVFVDEDQISSMEERMQEKGYLEGGEMANTFNMLRANDLIWSFVVNNYLLGKEPFPFDLLHWNSDTTRMPAAMHSQYMRGMYLDNKLVRKGGITIDDTPIDVRSITTPSFILSAQDDHIAPWKSTYQSTELYGGPIEFVLAASGHIAGVINPPTKKKYSYQTSNAQQKAGYPKQPNLWLETTTENSGSWWPYWEKWLHKKSGKKIAARKFTAAEKKKFTAAPGDYVKTMS